MTRTLPAGLLILALSLLPACAPAGAEGEPAHAATVFTGLSFEAGLDRAREEGRLLVVDFMADWCGPCRRMDRDTWAHASVRDWFRDHAVGVQVDVDARARLAGEYRADGIPLIVVFRDGKEVSRRVGYQSPAGILDWLAGLSG